MINKKGQTLILFVILIPLILALGALVTDITYISEAQNKLTNTTSIIIEEALNKNLSDNDIKKLYEKNQIDTSNLKITRTPNKINIKLQDTKPSIFGGIIGIKEYKVKVNMFGTNKDNKIIIDKE